MLPSLFVRDDLVATFAGKVNDLELIAEIAIHDRRIESICLAARTAHGLVEPLFKAVITKDLLAVAALYILLMHDVKADWTDERIDEFLVSFHNILLHKLIVASQTEHIVVSCLVYRGNKVFGLPHRALLEPGMVQEWNLVMRHYHDFLLVLRRCSSLNHTDPDVNSIIKNL